ncbi:hypothetical protein D9M71_193160 [compost metagenome]
MVAEAGEVALVQHFPGDGTTFGGRAAFDLQPQFDVATDAAPGHQEVLLQHEGHLAHRAGDPFATYVDFALGGGIEAGAHVQQRALAAAGRADDGHDLATADAEVQTLHRDGGLSLALDREALGDTPEFDLDTGLFRLGRALRLF